MSILHRHHTFYFFASLTEVITCILRSSVLCRFINVLSLKDFLLPDFFSNKLHNYLNLARRNEQVSMQFVMHLDDNIWLPILCFGQLIRNLLLE